MLHRMHRPALAITALSRHRRSVRLISNDAIGDLSTWPQEKIIHFFKYTPVDAFPISKAEADERTKPYFRYELIYQSKKSRARTPHGEIDTPGFVPVATTGALKFVDPVFADKYLNTQLMFCNTYHLLVHPGADAVAAAGGLHNFNKYTKPLITDSGGFQVFSLSNTEVQDELKGKVVSKYHQNSSSIVKLSEEGVRFRSYLGGSAIDLSPESSVEAQKKIGADIIIPLDILLANATTDKKRSESLHRTHRWEARSLIRHLKELNNQAMYSVIHGGTDKVMRRLSTEYLTQLPFQGHAIGGSLGRTREDMVGVVSQVTPLIPADKPIHLLGIGDLKSIDAAIPLGIDTFDSAYPTRSGRHGQLFSDNGEISMSRSEHAKRHRSGPVEGCECPTCSTHSAAYLHHLFKMHEPLAMMLGTAHNIHFMMRKMAKIRKDILDGNL